MSRSYHEALLECMSTETTIRMQLFCMSICQYPSFSSCFLLLCTSLIRRTSRVFHGFGERWVWFFRAASRSASRLLVDCARCIAFIEEAVQYSQALFRTKTASYALHAAAARRHLMLGICLYHVHVPATNVILRFGVEIRSFYGPGSRTHNSPPYGICLLGSVHLA